MAAGKAETRSRHAYGNSQQVVVGVCARCSARAQKDRKSANKEKKSTRYTATSGVAHSLPAAHASSTHCRYVTPR